MFLFLALPALLLVPSCSPQASHPVPIDHEQVSDHEKIVIRFSHVVGEDTPKGQAARLFAKLMKERTNGKVEVQVFSNSSLYTDSEELNALSEGHVQIIAPALSKLTHMVPGLGAFDLPFLFSSLEGYHQVFAGPIGKDISESLEEKGMVVLGFWDSGFKQFTNNVRPVLRPLDLAGTTIRIMPSAVLDQQFHLMQVNPVQMNFDDVYRALEQGWIQGQENTISNIYSKRYHTVQKYMTISDHGYLGYVVVINKEFLHQLPEDVQDVIHKTMEEVSQWERKQAVKLEQEKLNEIYNCRCIEIERLTEQDKAMWKEFYKPLYHKMEQQLGRSFFLELRL